jgi:hypothetical protein
LKNIRLYPKTKVTHIVANSISPATKHIPDWYKDIPQFIEGTKNKVTILPNSTATNGTIKRCTPFLDALSAGYMLVLSADIEVQEPEPGVPFIRWRDDVDRVTTHSEEQHPNLPVPEGFSPYVFKWTNDWCTQTPPGYSMWFTHPSNRFDLPFQTINGFVDTDRYEGYVQFPFFIKKGFTGIIEAGTPVCQLLPVKRDGWRMSHEEFNEDRSTREKFNLLKKIERSYKSQWWVKKTYQ